MTMFRWFSVLILLIGPPAWAQNIVPTQPWSSNGTSLYYDNGFVGIGTTNPTTAKLVIAGLSGAVGLDLSSNDQYADVRILRNTLNADHTMYIGYQQPSGGQLQFFGQGNTPQMVLLGSTGNVGISTTSPGALLDVSGGQIRTSGTTPTIANNACGSTTQGTLAGTDVDGLLTVGTAAVTSCGVSLSKTYTNAFRGCVLFPANATAAATSTAVAYVSAISTSSWTLTGTALASAAYYYHCE